MQMSAVARVMVDANRNTGRGTLRRRLSAMPDIISLPTLLDERSDGTIYARCPIPLGPYATCITDRLEHWARHAPDRTFLAQTRC